MGNCADSAGASGGSFIGGTGPHGRSFPVVFLLEMVFRAEKSVNTVP